MEIKINVGDVKFVAEDKHSMQELAKAFGNQAGRIGKPCNCKGKCKGKKRG